MRSPAQLQGVESGSAKSSPARRLVAIAMMDVVGFSSLVERDEDATLDRWRLLRVSCIQPAIERWRGRIFRMLGDGMLVEFPTAQEALSCLIEIQRGFAGQAPEAPILRLRGGIHAGDVVVEDDDLLGDTVNIAARLQDLAAPGGILVSAAVEQFVRGRITEAMEDLGNLALKNIARPVRAFSLLERPMLLTESRLHGGSSGRPSVAVLPFAENDSPSGSGYFGDGIVEDIVNALATLPDLFVVSRTSTLGFRSGASDIRRVGQDLGVRYVLSGSVRRAKDRIRISTELSDTESLGVLWSDRIEGRFDDIFELQDRVSQRIVATIAPQLREAEMMRVARK